MRVVGGLVATTHALMPDGKGWGALSPRDIHHAVAHLLSLAAQANLTNGTELSCCDRAQRGSSRLERVVGRTTLRELRMNSQNLVAGDLSPAIYLYKGHPIRSRSITKYSHGYIPID
ncbi:MAG: hypothetical protein ACUVR3_12415 [Candidatus Roseilinea sp.]|uniref:hypothetical protein n=1 Tax=Candidatus Roseilinea sp. TaxID=2838777 RepID=UPI00404AF14F